MCLIFIKMHPKDFLKAIFHHFWKRAHFTPALEINNDLSPVRPAFLSLPAQLVPLS